MPPFLNFKSSARVRYVGVYDPQTTDFSCTSLLVFNAASVSDATSDLPGGVLYHSSDSIQLQRAVSGQSTRSVISSSMDAAVAAA